jgi:hypothetical protein
VDTQDAGLARPGEGNLSGAASAPNAHRWWERAYGAADFRTRASCSFSATRNLSERGQLLKSVLLNCATDGANLAPTYRKPFDVIFQRAKIEEWSGRPDLNRGPPAPKAGALPGCATPRHEVHYLF